MGSARKCGQSQILILFNERSSKADLIHTPTDPFLPSYHQVENHRASIEFAVGVPRRAAIKSQTYVIVRTNDSRPIRSTLGMHDVEQLKPSRCVEGRLQVFNDQNERASQFFVTDRRVIRIRGRMPR